MQAIQTPAVPRGLPLLAAALAALLLIQPAVAQEKAPAKPPAKGTAPAASKAKADLMTRDELRACMNEQDVGRPALAQLDGFTELSLTQER